MNDFIETLKLVGGLRSPPDTVWNEDTPMPEDYTCQCGISVHPTRVNLAAIHIKDCSYRPVIDLAPLLADTGELTDAANDLLCSSKLFEPASCEKCFEVWARPSTHIHVVGPQRASNLIYEVARQLGGTAVTAEEPIFSEAQKKFLDKNRDKPNVQVDEGYRLSLPVPDSTTVLFVTDKVNEQEMREIISVVWRNSPSKTLMHILALVSNQEELEVSYLDVSYEKGAEPRKLSMKVIALHKES